MRSSNFKILMSNQCLKLKTYNTLSSRPERAERSEASGAEGSLNENKHSLSDSSTASLTNELPLVRDFARNDKGF